MFLEDNDVRRAFAMDEFFPLFQPIVELRTGRISGFEALARWNHARLGRIAPDIFIPIVQDCGFINTLTRRLLEKTFAAAHVLPYSVGLAVNLSPLQLLDSTLPGQIAASAERGGFGLERLTIEMTESALLDDPLRALDIAQELKSLGCRLSLDDFGTGHSSLFHLHALPFDELKIDRSFVSTVTESRESRKILNAVAALGRNLGLITVAEGVETAGQAVALSGFGCDLAQGWFFGRPVAAGDLPRVLGARPGARSVLADHAESNLAAVG